MPAACSACTLVAAGKYQYTVSYGRKTTLIQGEGKRPVKNQNFFRHLVPTPVFEWVAASSVVVAGAGAAAPARSHRSQGGGTARTMVAHPWPCRLYPRKVEMKTLVSRLSVACHQRSGKYRTCRERVAGDPTGSWGYSLPPPTAPGSDSPPRGGGCTPAAAQPAAAQGTCGGARPASSRWGGSGAFYPAGTETSAGRHR